MRELGYIIVGGGIAGCCIALELEKRGKSFVIFDASLDGAASRVAAGVINPITGQRLVKSWRSELAHDYAKKYYSNLESVLGANFYHPRKILQLCRSEEECALWERRALEPDYMPLLGGHMHANSLEQLNDARGSWLIERSAWVEPPVLMSAFQDYFFKRAKLERSRFDYSNLKIEADFLTYSDIRAKRVIFCEGWRALENPFFKWLPYRPAKGEILTLESSVELPEHIIHRGNWIMKIGDSTFRIGSTWDRENLNGIPTDVAKSELLAAAPPFFKSAQSFSVRAHEAGVRPCTATTRPHLGVHPSEVKLLSFNGFGSKGFALSPYFAHVFASHIEDGAPLDSEADLKRHIKKFFKP